MVNSKGKIKIGNYNLANTRNLQKIITLLLQSDIPRTYSEIRERILNHQKLRDGLNFLVLTNIVQKVKDKNLVFRYKINPEWMKL